MCKLFIYFLPLFGIVNVLIALGSEAGAAYFLDWYSPGCHSRCGALIPVISNKKAELWEVESFLEVRAVAAGAQLHLGHSDSCTALRLSLSRLVKEKQMLP